ncbi:peptidylprolyl isomerase [bacterium]|nr:peptidylprolyl isomerase [bacterium]
MNSKKLLTAIALSAVLFAGCGLKSKETIVLVNDTPITYGQFNKLFKEQSQNTMFSQMGIKITKEKNGFMYYLIQDRVVNELIVNTLLQQEAEKRGINVTEEQVNKTVEDLMNQVGGNKELGRILKQHGLTEKQFREDVKKELTMKELAKSVGNVSVSDAEVKKYYQQNTQKFKLPDKVRASHILIDANEDALRLKMKEDFRYKNLSEEELNAKINEKIKEREAKANELFQKVKANPSEFAKFAKENSQDKTTAINGGDLGFFAANEMVPEFSAAAFDTKPGSLTNRVVKSKFGYHIIMVTDRMESSQQPFEKVKSGIKNYLENQKQIKALDNLTESLKRQAKIEYVNSEFDPKAIQKGIEKEINEAPKKIQDAEKANKKPNN